MISPPSRRKSTESISRRSSLQTWAQVGVSGFWWCGCYAMGRFPCYLIGTAPGLSFQSPHWSLYETHFNIIRYGAFLNHRATPKSSSIYRWGLFGYPWLWKPNIYQSITISHYSPPFTTMNHHIHSTWNIHEIFTIHFLDTSMAVETHPRSIQGSGDEARNGSSTSPAPWCPLAAPASRPRGPRRRPWRNQPAPVVIDLANMISPPKKLWCWL